jgi:glycine/D-amino acid oxidase-like deaminating enzyme
MSDGRSTDGDDLLIVGGGVFGLSIAWEAARRGKRTRLLERRTIPNPIAASYGPSRKIRSTYLDPHYARLAQEAMVAWRRVEREVGQELYLVVGNLNFSEYDDQARLDELERVGREVGSSVRPLDQRELAAAFPQLRNVRRGLLETQAGYLKASACVEALRTLAERAGAMIETGQEVQAVEPSGAGLRVVAARRSYQAEQVVLAGGGWSGRLVPGLRGPLWQCQQGILYLDGVPDAFKRPAFVPFSCADNGFYGFPAEDGVGLKVAEHILGEPIGDPDFDRSTTPAGFVEHVDGFLQKYLGLRRADYRATFDSCMYNLSPSNDFLLDFYPDVAGLFIATAGSGHGFKFGSMLGTIVVDRLDGVPSDRWSEQFSWSTFKSAEAVARPL